MLIAGVVCGVISTMGGCGQRFGRVDARPGDIPEGVTLPGAAAVIAAFEPVGAEVYPLSRLEGSGAGRRAVVHIRLIDAYGHDGKWPGVVRLEIGTDGAGTKTTHFVDLTEGESNARAFDSISRCYAIRVPAPGDGVASVNVRWLLLNAEGRPQAMEASGVLSPSK